MSRWESPFYGLTLNPEDKVRIHQEIFQLIYNSQGGFTHDEVYNMPIYLRYFYLRCLIEQKEKETKQAKESSAPPASKKVIQKPF